ncbi:MAG: SRPBCC domain-containing protein [Pseudomonadota bacterium]|uniref:SRPBCC family protein n=1 Tax=Phenylobacterium sp. TaxID=1871053 RepID=UPI0025E3910D|nr:SRPBCC domain-containing protein [Phenylobacterium sp.]MBT9472505.1 SRPBCC domain-containing protein [Phenylobacterium sp.]
MTAATIVVSHRFDASPERVFDAWLDPARAAKFLFATPTGEIVKVEIDARVGGGFLIIDRRPEIGDAEHFGRYVEIDRPRRLVFDFAARKDMKDATRVTIEIVPAGTGCELTLTHEGVWQDYAERTQGGWTMILEGLAQAL